MSEINGYDIEGIQLGMSATFAKTFTEVDIVLFAAVSGDNNAVHVNEEFAQTTAFKAPVRPGDTVHATVTVTETIPEKRRIKLETVCTVAGRW